MLAAGASYPDITANVIHTGALPVGALQNIATVINPNENPANNFGNNNTDPANVVITPQILACIPGTTVGLQTVALTSTSVGLCPAGVTVGNFSGTQNPNTGIFSYNWSCNASSVGGACSAQFNPNSITTTTFDLSLKKYVNSVSAANDAQTPATAIPVTAATNYSYVIRVRNNGIATASGLTTVTDPGVTGVLFVSSPVGTGWACNLTGAGGAGFVCTRSDTLAANTDFPDITITAQVLSTTTATYTNTATVANPNENPLNNFGNNNTDPANVSVGVVVVGTPVCQ